MGEHERAVVLRLGGLAGVVAGFGWLVSIVLIAVALRFRVNDPLELIERVADDRFIFVAGNVVAIAVQVALVVFAAALVFAASDRSRPWALAGGLLLVLAAALWAASAVQHMVYANISAPHFEEASGVLRTAILEDSEVSHQIADALFFAASAAASVALLAYVPAVRGGPYGRPQVLLAWAVVVLFAVQFLWFIIPAFGVAGALGQVLYVAWLVDTGMRTARLS